MKITEVYLKNFGKFSEEKIQFHDGINLFYGENESGKTTIHTFIKCMLFGLERGRGRASIGDTYSLYEPWENSNYYAGVLRFETGGKHFCLTRNFDKYGKSASLICEDDGEEFSLEHGDLELILPGITASNYENTIAIGQMRVETNHTLAQELQNYATNYYATGNSDIDLVGAQESLTKQKKEVEKEIRIMEQERAQKRRDIDRDLDHLAQDISVLEGKIKAIDQQMEEAARDAGGTKKKGRARVYEWILLLLGVALLLQFVPEPWNYISSAIFIVLMGVLTRFKTTRKQEEAETQPKRENNMPRLQMQRELWAEDWKEKQVKYENLREELEELDEKGVAYKQKEALKLALEFAIQRMTELAKETSQEVGNRLNERVSGIVKEITGGKYELLRVDKDLKISLYCDGRMIGLDQVSRGTIEQIYFALRMAASELLFEEAYPVILDDTFVFYDEKRLANTLKWLKENKKQVLLFTCQKREGELLAEYQW